MYRERGIGGSKAEVDHRKHRVSDVLDKHLDRSSPSSSRPTNGNDLLLFMNKQQPSDHNNIDHLLSKDNNASDVESETDSEESDVSGSEGDDTTWISWFCNLRGNEFFCEVDDDYIQDDFNLCGLSTQIPYYDYALDLISDVESSHGDMFTEEQNELVESAAEMLYGLIHARYILTSKGMAAMLDKYKNYDFGRCPRVHCCGQPCLPVGQSDIPRSSNIKICCPRCDDIYYPRSKYQGSILIYIQYSSTAFDLVGHWHEPLIRGHQRDVPAVKTRGFSTWISSVEILARVGGNMDWGRGAHSLAQGLSGSSGGYTSHGDYIEILGWEAMAPSSMAYMPPLLNKKYPSIKDIDGAYFGTTFPHLFLMTYGHLKPQKVVQSYVPRVFGFKIHKQ
ncbi:hypothetical protein DKX38_004217 [Salix brachista]|uniref:Casein kinase II subunit beta n=1 Tax=Salix brachista TaxID=2182728 RepID=A0A5N5NBZ9_9ROSI|nr:hypothetical protein DKX38_004217 [Salix brachista]